MIGWRYVCVRLGFQYQFALNYSAPASFDAVAFAQGFGSHLAEDAVGHFSPDGYSLLFGVC